MSTTLRLGLLTLAAIGGGMVWRSLADLPGSTAILSALIGGVILALSALGLALPRRG